jgi:hypothetical protein
MYVTVDVDPSEVLEDLSTREILDSLTTQELADEVRRRTKSSMVVCDGWDGQPMLTFEEAWELVRHNRALESENEILRRRLRMVTV